MEDPAEQLIRRALGRRPPPTLGPTFAEDVVRRVAATSRPVTSGRGASWWLAIPWLAAAGASVAVLAHLEWSGPTRAVAWGLALGMVPLAYSATLWPRGALSLLALCGGPLPGKAREGPPPVTPASPSRGHLRRNGL